MGLVTAKPDRPTEGVRGRQHLERSTFELLAVVIHPRLLQGLGRGRRNVLIGDYFPLLVQIQPKVLTAESIAKMGEEFEVYFRRGERYVVVSLQAKNAHSPSATERKLVADWVNSPRVMEFGGRLCVASANVSRSAFERGMLTALLWIWRPPFPLKPFPTVEAALDYALEMATGASLQLPMDTPLLRRIVLERLRDFI